MYSNMFYDILKCFTVIYCCNVLYYIIYHTTYIYILIFRRIMGDVESSNNEIENHRSTLRNISYILQFILRQLDHIPIILISLLFVSTAIPGWLTELGCIIISIILSGIINLILYVKRLAQFPRWLIRNKRDLCI